jgi:hypothetical protein
MADGGQSQFSRRMRMEFVDGPRGQHRRSRRWAAGCRILPADHAKACHAYLALPC